MRDHPRPRFPAWLLVAASALLGPSTLFGPSTFLGPRASLAPAAEEWEPVLQLALQSPRSQTRHEGLKQVDASSARGLKALWAALSITDPNRVDWFVREGAYEALIGAEGEEADAEIERLSRSSGNDLPKEAVLQAIVWKIRKEVVKEYGGDDDREIEEAKSHLRKKRGVEYFEYVLPSIRRLDPEKKLLARLQRGLADKSERVRRAAISGLMAYPDHSSIPLLLDNLKKLEKRKGASYREWVFTRFALEVLTGQYYRESVADWFRWWETARDQFTIEKRIEEESGKDDGSRGTTVVVRKEGVEVTVNMKVAGEKGGVPLLVVPWRGYEVDYFRPYFHGVEEFCRVFYVRMPQIDDFKGLARDAGSNLIKYPTEFLAKALVDVMKESGLESFALLAHGPDAGVLSMFLAAEEPSRVTHLVLINPRSAGSAYTQSIESVRREGLRTKNDEIVKGADNITLMPDNKPKYTPGDPGEQGGLGRALGNLKFADPTEPEVGALGYLHDLPGGSQVLNDSTWSARKIVVPRAAKIPTLIFIGEKSPWTPISDVKQVAGLFERAKTVSLPGSSETPFMSHTYEFTKYLQAFLGGSRAGAKASKKGSAKADSKGSTKGSTGTR